MTLSDREGVVCVRALRTARALHASAHHGATSPRRCAGCVRALRAARALSGTAQGFRQCAGRRCPRYARGRGRGACKCSPRRPPLPTGTREDEDEVHASAHNGALHSPQVRERTRTRCMQVLTTAPSTPHRYARGRGRGRSGRRQERQERPRRSGRQGRCDGRWASESRCARGAALHASAHHGAISPQVRGVPRF